MWLYACGQAVLADHIISGPAPRILCCMPLIYRSPNFWGGREIFSFGHTKFEITTISCLSSFCTRASVFLCQASELAMVPR